MEEIRAPSKKKTSGIGDSGPGSWRGCVGRRQRFHQQPKVVHDPRYVPHSHDDDVEGALSLPRLNKFFFDDRDSIQKGLLAIWTARMRKEQLHVRQRWFEAQQ